jgi:hypothetical protein
MRHFSALAAGAMILLGACSSSEKGAAANRGDLGTGVNTVERQYGKPADTVWDATVAAAKSYDLRIDSDRHDDLGGELLARRADGHRVSAKVSALDKNSSRVSVRVEPGNRDLAQMLHERIADKLGMGEAKSAFLGGNSVDGTYACDFSSALAAAERSAKALNYTITHQEGHDTWAQVDARAQDSTPVRFKMTRTNDRTDSTRVTFIAGNGKTDSSQTLISQMKAEFDRQISSGVR